jgi:hypothetical protein
VSPLQKLAVVDIIGRRGRYNRLFIDLIIDNATVFVHWYQALIINGLPVWGLMDRLGLLGTRIRLPYNVGRQSIPIWLLFMVLKFRGSGLGLAKGVS